MSKLEITGATLLSVEEAEQLNEDMLKASDNWWLRSPGLVDRAACVYGISGSVRHNGDYVENSFGVRPALTISNLESTNLGIGDTIAFGDHDFTIISDRYALCDDIIGKCAFRKDWKVEGANVYEESDVEKFVNDWFIRTKERKEPISFEIPIYTDAISIFEYATGNNPGHYDVVGAVVDQIVQGDPAIESVAEELDEMAAGDSDLLVYRVSCEFDVDKYAKEYDLKGIDEQDEDKEI